MMTKQAYDIGYSYIDMSYDESIDLAEIKMKSLQRLKDFEIGKIMKEFKGVL